MAAKKKKKKKKTKKSSRRGFARLSAEERSEIARRGAAAMHAAGKAHRFTSSEARAAVLKSWESSPVRAKPKDED
jgi:hypothetical protein